MTSYAVASLVRSQGRLRLVHVQCLKPFLDREGSYLGVAHIEMTIYPEECAECHQRLTS